MFACAGATAHRTERQACVGGLATQSSLYDPWAAKDPWRMPQDHAGATALVPAFLFAVHLYSRAATSKRLCLNHHVHCIGIPTPQGGISCEQNGL
jgi:hypothetical protein